MASEEPKSDEIRSTINHLKEFKQLAGWLDIVDFIDERIEHAYEALETLDDIHKIAKVQGSIAQLKDIKDLPDWYISELEAQQKDKEDENA